MEDNYTKGSYGKRPLWQWILLYLIIAAVVYGLVYYFVIAKKGGYNYQPNASNSPAGNTSTSLNLSGKGLTSIPSYVFNQTSLEELNVSNNSLTGAIQSQIGQLKNLKALNASYNKMTGVPAEIGQLQNLRVLDLSYNQLTGLPNELGNPQNLQTLNLAGNQYSQQDLNLIESRLPPTVNIIK